MVDIAALARLGGVKKYAADEVFFNFGDRGKEMFIILKGRVGVYINSFDGFQTKVAELKAGDFFGEMSLLEGLPRSATISSLEETVVLIINDANFEQVIAQQPSLALRIMKGMSNRVRQQNEELSFLKRGSKQHDEEALEGEVTAAPAAPVALSGAIFPPGHKSYPVMAPQTHEPYLFDRDTDCPVCEKKFPVRMMRSSKMRLERVDPDMRQRFEEFEPVWYNIWVCPHCLYANFNFEFKQISDALKPKIIEHGKTLKSKINLTDSKPRKIDEVFLSYYLALQTAQQAAKPDSGKLAKLWIRLSWLYSDVGDEEMYEYTSREALANFKDSFFNGRRDTSVEQDQRLNLVLGELSLRLGEKEEAMKFFRDAIVRKGGGNNVLNKQAEDRLSELRKAVTENESGV
ncbi:DUF2225 domain-containing protein [Syntrophomonas palmitatica]|uniref:DUF2225 domain-containing protein n=1 Tax=Syntrophomonas palmitatica TaxID=402877 RepID=UPI0006D145CE|nr:DUF2225 domain-containing protein [Syntrophomonas palmitatica]